MTNTPNKKREKWAFQKQVWLNHNYYAPSLAVTHLGHPKHQTGLDLYKGHKGHRYKSVSTLRTAVELQHESQYLSYWRINSSYCSRKVGTKHVFLLFTMNMWLYNLQQGQLSWILFHSGATAMWSMFRSCCESVGHLMHALAIFKKHESQLKLVHCFSIERQMPATRLWNTKQYILIVCTLFFNVFYSDALYEGEICLYHIVRVISEGELQIKVMRMTAPGNRLASQNVFIWRLHSDACGNNHYQGLALNNG